MLYQMQVWSSCRKGTLRALGQMCRSRPPLLHAGPRRSSSRAARMLQRLLRLRSSRSCRRNLLTLLLPGCSSDGLDCPAKRSAGVHGDAGHAGRRPTGLAAARGSKGGVLL